VTFYPGALPFAAAWLVVFFLVLHLGEWMNRKWRIKQPERGNLGPMFGIDGCNIASKHSLTSGQNALFVFANHR
jgi:hypothetical protein